MFQTTVMRILANPAVLDTLEMLLVSTIIYGSKSIMDRYIDHTARKRAGQIINRNKGKTNGVNIIRKSQSNQAATRLA